MAIAAAATTIAVQIIQAIVIVHIRMHWSVSAVIFFVILAGIQLVVAFQQCRLTVQFERRYDDFR